MRDTPLHQLMTIAICLLILNGCQAATPVATVTTIPPSATPTPAPTATSMPTLTPTLTPRPPLLLPSTYEGHLPEGAYSVLGLGEIISVELSANGEYLAVLTGMGLGVYQAKDLELVWFEVVQAGGFTSSRVRWSPDGSKIAIIASRDAIVWNVLRGEELCHLNLSYGPMYESWEDIAWSPDNSLVAIWGTTEEIVLWNVVTKKVLHELPTQRHILDMQWSPDSQWLAAKTETGEVTWSVISGDPLKETDALPEFTWPGPEETTTSLDDSRIISIDANRVLIQDATTKSEIETLHPVIGTYIRALAWSTDSNTLAIHSICSYDPCIIIWDVHTATPLNIRRGDTASGYEFTREFPDKSPDGSRSLTYGVGGGQMTLWDTNTNQAIQDLDTENECEYPCLDLAWSPDSRWLIAVMYPRLFIWDAYTGALAKRISPYPFGDFGDLLALSPDGKLLATVVGGAVIVWEVP